MFRACCRHPGDTEHIVLCANPQKYYIAKTVGSATAQAHTVRMGSQAGQPFRAGRDVLDTSLGRAMVDGKIQSAMQNTYRRSV